MDPQTCFAQWMLAVNAGELDDARELQDAYADWRRKGGFAAKTPDGNEVAQLETSLGRYEVWNGSGYEWCSCFACADPVGPFDSEDAAIADAQGGAA